jgi:hypothetical protein
MKTGGVSIVVVVTMLVAGSARAQGTAPPPEEAPLEQWPKDPGTTRTVHTLPASSLLFGPRVGMERLFGTFSGKKTVGDADDTLGDVASFGGSFGAEAAWRTGRSDSFIVSLAYDHTRFGAGSSQLFTSTVSSNRISAGAGYVTFPYGVGVIGEFGFGFRFLSSMQRADEASGAFTELDRSFVGQDFTLSLGLFLKPAPWLAIIPRVTGLLGSFRVAYPTCTTSPTGGAAAISCDAPASKDRIGMDSSLHLGVAANVSASYSFDLH